jgi:two-component sensor histidine kinase
LIALSYFEYRGKFFHQPGVKRLIQTLKLNRKNFVKRTFFGAIIIAVIFFGLFFIKPNELPLFGTNWPNKDKDLVLINLPALLDAFILGIPTIGVLWIILTETWVKRKFREMKWLTQAILLFVGVMQFLNATNFGKYYFETNLVLVVSYKILLIIVFFALAFAWTFDKLKDQKNELITQRQSMNHAIRSSLSTLIIYVEKSAQIEPRDKVNSIPLIREIISRINCFFEIHDLLHEEKSNANFLDFSLFVERLLAALRKSLGYDKQNFDFSVKLEALKPLQYNQVADLGMVITELILNAWKYSPEDQKWVNGNVLFKDNVLYATITNKEYSIDYSNFKKTDRYGMKMLEKIINKYKGDIRYLHSGIESRITCEFTIRKFLIQEQ